MERGGLSTMIRAMKASVSTSSLASKACPVELSL